MNAAETLAKQFADGMPGLIAAIRAVPEDKLDWKPAEGNRTIRAVFTEAVMMPGYVAEALKTRAIPEYDDRAAAYAEMTIEELITKLESNAKELAEAQAAFPEADYELEFQAPWGVWTYFQTMAYPYWNMMWHCGQINYVQAMYGDQNFY